MARKRKNSNEAVKRFGEFMKENKVAVAAFLVVALVVTGAFIWFNDFFRSSDCFSVDKVEIVKPGREGAYRLQKEYFRLEFPVNIFTVDPSMLAAKIKKKHSEYQIVVITKFLPDRIIATIKDREAVARIKVAKVLPIDFDGVVVSETENLDSLPLITGLESQLADPKPGTKVKSKRLNAALGILKQLYSMGEFRDSQIGSLNMTYPDKASVSVDGITAVLGSGDIQGKLDVLASILGDPELDKTKVDSIDLRFTDPVMTFKPEKK